MKIQCITVNLTTFDAEVILEQQSILGQFMIGDGQLARQLTSCIMHDRKIITILKNLYRFRNLLF